MWGYCEKCDEVRELERQPTRYEVKTMLQKFAEKSLVQLWGVCVKSELGIVVLSIFMSCTGLLCFVLYAGLYRAFQQVDVKGEKKKNDKTNK